MHYIAFSTADGDLGRSRAAILDADGVLVAQEEFLRRFGPDPRLLSRHDDLVALTGGAWLNGARRSPLLVQAMLARSGAVCLGRAIATLRKLAVLGYDVPEPPTREDRGDAIQEASALRLLHLALESGRLASPARPARPRGLEADRGALALLLSSRCVALDCEMTGTNPQRLVEAAAVEIVGGAPTGRTFHTLVRTPSPIEPIATRIHGLAAEDLVGAPAPAEALAGLIRFIDGAPIVCHEAASDAGVLEREAILAGLPSIPGSEYHCTALLSARFNGRQKLGLDRLCDRYGVDRSARLRHGALIDASLVAEILPRLAEEIFALADDA